MEKKELDDDLELGAGSRQGGDNSSSQPDGDSSDSPDTEEDFPSDSYQSTQGALLGATLRANVFNPEFLPNLSGQQMSLPSDEDVAPEQFPSLLSASLRSNVFNPDFLDRVVESHVQDRAEAHVQARGLESHPSLARKVTSRAPALIDHAIAQALNEELATTMPHAKQSNQIDLVQGPSARSNGVDPPVPVVIDLTRDGQAGEPSEQQQRTAKQIEAPQHEKLPPLKRVWRKFLQPHSQLASQVEALVTLAILAGVLLCCLWLAIGHAAAPDGAVFSLVVVYLAAVVFGELAARVGTHPLVGMLIAGFICRYVPGVKAGRVIPHEVSAFIREFGLCTILLRAGIALDIKLLMRLKWLSFACSVFPTVVEAAVLAAMSVLLFSLPWTWAFMTGFIVAGVAPAIVVPALLALQDEGFGVAKGIPSLVLAVAAVDDCLSVIGNAVFNNVIFSHSELVMSIFRAPIEIAMGIAIGVGLGFGAILLLPRSRPVGVISRQDSMLKRRANQHRTDKENSVHRRQNKPSSPPVASPADAASNPGSDAESGSTKVLKAIKDKIKPQKMLPPVPPGDGVKMALMRTAYVLGFGLWCIMGGQKIKYSGAGALAVVILGAMAGQGWGRELSSKPKLYLLYTWALLAQPLLFGVIGSQIDVSYFKGSFLWRGVIILPVAAIARAIVTVGSTFGTVLNTSERIFLALAWLPKATVQAALAPQALSQVAGKHDPKLTEYAQTVFAIGMLSVILTAPLGAMFLKLSGPRLLDKADKRPEQVMHAE